MSDPSKPVAMKDRFFEDFSPGEVFEFGDIAVGETDIIEFARRYDPQPFHIDPAAAAQSIYGGIIASGWHTTSLLMRAMVDNFISARASLGSPGVENIRWPRPVRGGDVLSCRLTIEDLRRSRSKPDRGILTTHAEMLNQRGEQVLEMTSVSFMLCRRALSNE